MDGTSQFGTFQIPTFSFWGLLSFLRQATVLSVGVWIWFLDTSDPYVQSAREHVPGNDIEDAVLMWAISPTPTPIAKSMMGAEDYTVLGHYSLTKWTSVGLCASLAILFVLLLYLMPVILNLPPPRSEEEHLLRRFGCALLASLLSALICGSFLPWEGNWRTDLVTKLRAFGLRLDNLGQAVIFPLLLTIILYLGPLVMIVLDERCEVYPAESFRAPLGWLGRTCSNLLIGLRYSVRDVTWWRNYVVAPLSEEFVFRACMIPLLLCGGFSTLVIIFLSPLFFSAAHLHHFGELVYEQRYTKGHAAFITAVQFVYTNVFGWYATFWYLRTGHLVAPVVAHVFCNFMGVPDPAGLCSKNKVVPMSFVAGLGCFALLLGPASAPSLYNEAVQDCGCWLGYCRYLKEHFIP